MPVARPITHPGTNAEGPEIRAAARQWPTRLLIAASLLPFLVLTAIHWDIGPIITRSDYAQYLLHAEALLQGRSYTDIGFLFSADAPFAGPEAYPPGLPFTLAPILAGFGRNAVMLKLLLIACAIGWLWCAARYLEKRCGIWIACGAVMMTGVAIENSFATNVVNSDLGFAALTWALLLSADAEGEWSWRRALIVLLIGTAAMAYRVVGLAAVPALLIYAVVRWRGGARWAMGPVVVWFAIAIAALSVLPITTQYQHTVFSDPASLPSRVEQNVRPLRAAALEAMLYPLPSERLNDVYHAAALLLVGIGAVAFLRRNRVNYLVCFMVCYTGMLLIAPAAVARYWWPLFPVLAAWLLTGVEQLIRLARVSRFAVQLPFAFALVLALGAVPVSAARAAPETLPENADVQALFETLRNTPGSQSFRVYFVNPRVMTLETGIAAMPFIGVTEAELLSQLRAKAITHVVSGIIGTGRQAQRTLLTTIAQHPELFAPIYRNDTFTLYRFVGR